jgi:Cytochrome c oxidase subunit IV
MKVEALFFLGVTGFFVVIGGIYAFTAYEDAGTTMLAASALLGLLAGGYLLVQSRRIEPRPEDRPDASVAEGAGPVSEFPAASIWPFVLGLGATAVATGLVFGVWVLILGGGVFALAVVGYVSEGRRAG